MMHTRPDQLQSERRRFQRIEISLGGRYMLTNRLEFACRTLDISAGGVALAAPVRGEIGERAVLYLDHVGRLEGAIARYIEPGFVVALQVSSVKRERLADRLTWLSNRSALDFDRRHERIVPHRRHCVLQMEGSEELFVRILNVSVSGVAIATEVRPPLRSQVTLGKTPGHVVRHLDDGIVVGFDVPLPIDGFDENLTL
jgi:hypothetical protein